MPPPKRHQKPLVWRLSHQKLPLRALQRVPLVSSGQPPQQVRRAKQLLLHQYWSPPPSSFCLPFSRAATNGWPLDRLAVRVLRVDKNSCAASALFYLLHLISSHLRLHLCVLSCPVLSFPLLCLFHRSSSPSCRSQHRPSFCLRCVCVDHTLTAAGRCNDIEPVCSPVVYRHRSRIHPSRRQQPYQQRATPAARLLPP